MPYADPKKDSQYHIEYSKKYKRRISLDVRKTYYENVLCYIPEITGLGINTFIKLAITEKIQRDKLDLPIDQYKP